MECPTCSYPVLAEWSQCRRCGAPPALEQENRLVTVPPGLQRLRTARGSRPAPGAVATSAPEPSPAAAAYAAARPDTLLPGALPRPDNVLARATTAGRAAATGVRTPPAAGSPSAPRPRSTAGAVVRFARGHWRRFLVGAVVGVALTMSVVAVRPVIFANASPSPATGAVGAARASALLQTVGGGARLWFATQHSFADLATATLSARSYHVAIVPSDRVARAGAVSMRVTDAHTLTLATPVDSGRCAFARVVATVGTGPTGATFASVATTTCRANAAPAQGWRTR